MAKCFYVYAFTEGKEELVEKRENVEFKEDESIKHGDPKKAKATSSVPEGVDVLVGKKFGPNLPRLLKRFVCVVARTDSIANAVEVVHNNIDTILEQKGRGADRGHIVLKP